MRRGARRRKILPAVRRLLRALGVLLAVLALLVGAAWVVAFRALAHEERPAGGAPLPPAAEARGARLPRCAKQTENHCGAYSLAFALGAAGVTATGAELVPRVSHEVSWSETLTGTMPWKIREEALRRGVPAREWTARALAPEERLVAVKRHISRNRAVVLLIESERRSQHFVLAVGYAADGVRLYDPNFEVAKGDPSLTRDANGEEPGNRTLPDETLLAMWAKGGIAGLYTWWYLPIGE